MVPRHQPELYAVVFGLRLSHWGIPQMRILRCTLLPASAKHLVRNFACFPALAFAPFFFCGDLSTQTANPAPTVAAPPPPPLSPAMDALARARKPVVKYFDHAANAVYTNNP